MTPQPSARTDTERLDWLERTDPPVSIEWDGLSTWSLEVTGDIRLYQAPSLRAALDAAIAKEKEGWG